MPGTLRVKARFMMCVDTCDLTRGVLDMNVLVPYMYSSKLLAGLHLCISCSGVEIRLFHVTTRSHYADIFSQV